MVAIESPPVAAGQGQALQRAHLDVTVRGLDAAIAVSYAFRNAEVRAIEALFTFPMPLAAAFIGLSAEIGGETIEAEVIEARAAMRRYDDAVSEGDSALLLRQLAPGLLQASLGNLGPGEEARFVLRYALPLTVLDRRLRLRLPMNLRPRYGAWDLDELDEPLHDAGVEYALSARLRVEGFLAGASLACVSHPARFERRGEAAELALIDAWLDGDVVVEFGLDSPLPPAGECFPDGRGAGARVQVMLPPPAEEARNPLQTTLLLDCSGSMAGDAILGCRAALEAVAQVLDDGDRLQVLRFGNEVHPLLRRPIRMGAAVRRALVDLAATVQADLGGTEMGQALERALDGLALTRDPDCAQAIFLVTDGAVQPRDIEDALHRAVNERVRVFVVAVGSSASIEVLEPLATLTQGQLEQVMPGEAIAEAVVRQLRRMRQSAPVQVDFRFKTEAGPAEVSQLAYAGDAVAVQHHLRAPAATVQMRCALWNEPLDLALSPVEASPDRLALLGRARFDATQDEAQQRELALRYRLLSRFTSAILVKQRADGERFEELPEIRSQVHMQSRGKATTQAQRVAFSRDAPARAQARSDVDIDYLDKPAFLRRMPDPVDAESDSPVDCFEIAAGDQDDLAGSEAAPPPPAPSPPEPEAMAEALRAMRAIVLVELRREVPALDRETLLARLTDTQREALEWCLREELFLDTDDLWLIFIEAIALIEGEADLEEGTSDHLAEALLMAGYEGCTDYILEDHQHLIRALMAG